MSGSIVVIGSINLDLVCRAARIPKPGETLLGSDLVTIPGGAHGGFSAEERVRIYTVIREFLTKNGVMTR